MNVFRIFIIMTCVAGLTLITGCRFGTRGGIGLGIGLHASIPLTHRAPPPPRYEYRGFAPGPSYTWINGYWHWNGYRYQWVPGYWSAPHRDFYWVPHSWKEHDRGWRFHPGKWQYKNRGQWKKQERREFEERNWDR